MGLDADHGRRPKAGVPTRCREEASRDKVTV